MNYVDGYVLAVPTRNKEAYIKLSQQVSPYFIEHGALKVVECWGEDVPEGKVTSFPMAVQCKDDETVVFSWVTWPDKATRDKGMKAVMEDPRMFPDKDMEMPFDGKRMIFGGFEPIVEV